MDTKEIQIVYRNIYVLIEPDSIPDRFQPNKEMILKDFWKTLGFYFS